MFFCASGIHVDNVLRDIQPLLLRRKARSDGVINGILHPVDSVGGHGLLLGYVDAVVVHAHTLVFCHIADGLDLLNACGTRHCAACRRSIERTLVPGPSSKMTCLAL